MRPFLRQHWSTILLVLILLTAGVMRLSNPNWDQGSAQHPDERSILDSKTLIVTLPPGTTISTLLNPALSPINIRATQNLTYGTLPIYMLRASGAFLAGLLDKPALASDARELMLWGRTLSGIADLITVFLVFLIARRLFGRNAGLLAAAISALAVTQIQIAHFFIVEPYLVMFMTATLYFSVVLMQNRAWWAAALAGLMLGFAMACKVSVVPLALIIVAALVLRAVNRRRTRRLGPSSELDDPYGLTPANAAERSADFGRSLATVLPLLLLAGLTTFIGVFIGDPFAVLDSGLQLTFDPNNAISGTTFFKLGNFQAIAEQGKYLAMLGGEAAIQKGLGGAPYVLQYVGRTPFLDNIQQIVTWGLGLPTGLVAVAALIWSVVMALRGRPAMILMLLGIIPYFISIGQFEAKWMRYMLPLVPYLCIMTGAMLATGLHWSLTAWRSERIRSLPLLFRRYSFPVLASLTVLSSLLWAVAFMNIYTQDHSRIQASKWMLTNIPSDAAIGHEVWDDALPLNVPDPTPWDGNVDYPAHNGANDVSFPLYDYKPSPEAFDTIVDLLNRTEYINLASNRLYMSIPRVPWRYPVYTRYYQLLLEGKLGFELVNSTAVYPSLTWLGLTFVDDYADESFTVYDHPKVLTFQKTRTLSEDELRTLFGDVINRPAIDTPHYNNPEDKSIMLPEPVGQQVALGDYAWNELAQNQWVALVLLLIAVEVIGLLAWPLTAVVARRLPDRGYPLSKMLGILLVAWPVWILASARLIPFTFWSILLCIGLLALLSALLWRRFGAELREVWRAQRRLILLWEALFLVTFAAFVFVRLLNPDLWQPWLGGEKPMEFAFLNSVIRSPWMPPGDPFFSGGTLNYYYYGYFILAMLIKLTGIEPVIAFNLSIALLFGFTALGSGSLVYNAVSLIGRARGWRSRVSYTAFGYAVLGVALVQVIGNITFLLQFVSMKLPALQQAAISLVSVFGTPSSGLTRVWTNFDWWAVRDVTNTPLSITIDEFPFWTFLFSDLHPHLINMCFTLLVIGLAFNLMLGAWRWPLFRSLPTSLIDTAVAPYPAPAALAKGEGRGAMRGAVIEAALRMWGSEPVDMVLRFATLALALGTLFVINSWDFVTYAGLLLGTFLVIVLAALAEPAARSLRVRLAVPLAALVSLVAVVGFALLIYSPFLISFKALYTEIRTITSPAARTSLDAFLVMWAIFMFVTLSYLGLKLRQYPWRAGLADISGWLRLPQPSTSPIPATAMGQAPGQAILAPAVATVGNGYSGAFERVAAPVAVAGNNIAVAENHSDDYGLQDTGSLGVQFDDDDLSRFRRPATIESARSQYDFSAGASDDYTVDDAADEKEAPASLSRRPVPLESSQREPVFTVRVPRADSAENSSTTENSTTTELPEPEPELASQEPADDAIGATWQSSGTHLEEHAGPGSWIEDVEVADEPPTNPPTRRPLLGLIPAGAGLLILSLTGFIALYLLLIGAPLSALLVVIMGGLIGTHFGAVRNSGSLFAALLMVVAAAVALGVEYVYLADHLQGGNAFRMNTVFKFYMQVWILFGAGAAIAVYWLIGPKGTAKAPVPAFAVANPGDLVASSSNAVEPDSLPIWDSPEGAEIADRIEENATVEREPDEVQIVDVPEDAPADEPGPEPTYPEPVHAEPTNEAPRPAPSYISTVPVRRHVAVPALVESEAAPPATITPVSSGPVRIHEPQQWSLPRLIWLPIFGVLFFGGLIFTVAGTQGRVADRMPGARPDFGTLDGSAWMDKTTINLAFDDNNLEGPIAFTFERQALQWLNDNIKGTPVLAAGPFEYYRSGGMLVGTYTGLPMVVGGLHQDEQRYGWQVGERRNDINQFYREDDIPKALTIISKYDIEYIYVGQMEQTVYGPDGGLAKFEDMLQANATRPATLEIAYKNDVVKIYHVLGGVEQQVGAAPGTVRAVATPRPRPTEPPMENDPKLAILLAAVDANPDDAGSHNALADYYRDHAALTKAAEQYEIVIRLQPNNVSAHHILGDIYMQFGEKDKALAVWQAAAEDADAGDKAPAYNKLGIAYRDNGRYDDAIKAFQSAVQADSSFVESTYQLGEIYEQLQDKPKAIEAYQSVLANAHDDESGNGWKTRAQERLNALQ